MPWALHARCAPPLFMPMISTTGANGLSVLGGGDGCLDRVIIGGRFSVADFAICTQAETVVICDIEGAEEELLDPEQAPGLTAADILVEVHEGVRPGLLDRLNRRFLGQPQHSAV